MCASLLETDADALLASFKNVVTLPTSWNCNEKSRVAQWEGVVVESGRVTRVRLANRQQAGNPLSGSIDLSKLPATLTSLDLRHNALTGEVSKLQALSCAASLTELRLNNNQLGGILDLTNLPPQLKTLHVQNNKFSGSVALFDDDDDSTLSSQRDVKVDFVLKLYADADALLSAFKKVSNLPSPGSLQDISGDGGGGDDDHDAQESAWSHENRHNLDKWKGVTVDENGRITHVRLTGGGGNDDDSGASTSPLSGVIDLSKLPQKLRVLDLRNNRKLNGGMSDELTKLPPSLKELVLGGNKFFANSVNLTKLPATLRILDLQGNNLAGGLDMTKLPAALREVRLNDNFFESTTTNNATTASLDLTKLPASLVELDLHHNKFTDHVDLTQLPDSLETVRLEDNRFTSCTTWFNPNSKRRRKVSLDKQMLLYADADALLRAFEKVLPNSHASSSSEEEESLSSTWKRDDIRNVSRWKGVTVSSDSKRVTEVRLGNQQLSGSVDLNKLPHALEVLDLQQNKLDGGLDLTLLPPGLFELYLNGNTFSGALDLTKLPDNLEVLHLDDNASITSVTSWSLPAWCCNVVLDEAMQTVADAYALLDAFRNVQNHVDPSWNDQSLHDVKNWKGVSMGPSLSSSSSSSSSAHNRVVKVTLAHCGLKGQIDLTRLPRSLTHLDVQHNSLDSAVSFAQLPEGLEELRLNNNKLTGAVDFSGLEETKNIKLVDIQNNAFDRAVKLFPRNGYGGGGGKSNTACQIHVDTYIKLGADATALLEAFSKAKNLPDSWKMNYSSEDKESSTTASTSVQNWDGVKIDHAANRVSSVHLTHISGSLNVAALPSALKELILEESCSLAGALDLRDTLPPALEVLKLGNNDFTAVVVAAVTVNDKKRRQEEEEEEEEEEENTSSSPDAPSRRSVVMLLDLTQLPSTLTHLDLQSNDLSGLADLTNLPPSLKYLDLRNNNDVDGVILFEDIAELQQSFNKTIRLDDSTPVYPRDDARALLKAFENVTNLFRSWSESNIKNIAATAAAAAADANANDDIRGWHGVTVQHGRIVVVDVYDCGLGGSVSLAHLPSALRDFHLSYNEKLSGPMDLTRLPPEIRVCSLYCCNISGTIDLTHLPRTLEGLYLDNNSITGTSLDLSKLPSRLKHLCLHKNKFSKGIKTDLYNLKCKITLDEECFTVFRMTTLARDAEALLAAFRNVHGMHPSWSQQDRHGVENWIGVTAGVPSNSSVSTEEGSQWRVLRVDLDDGGLSGSIDLTKLPDGLQLLDLQKNELTGNADLSQLPPSLQFLFLNNNRFGGSIGIWKLPQSLQVLQLENNRFSGSTVLDVHSKCSVRLDDDANNEYLTVYPIADAKALLFGAFKNVSSLPTSWSERNLRHVERWKGITVNEKTGRVTQVALSNCKLGGTVDLTKLPSELSVLILDSNELGGTIDLTGLPSSLTVLDLQSNALTGVTTSSSTVPPATSSPPPLCLPPTLQFLQLQGNKFASSALASLVSAVATAAEAASSPCDPLVRIDDDTSGSQQQQQQQQQLVTDAGALLDMFENVTNLPRTTNDDCWSRETKPQVASWPGVTVAHGRVIEVRLERAHLAGELDLAKIPDGLCVLDVSDNALTGNADLTKLPPSLRILELQNNQLSSVTGGEVLFPQTNNFNTAPSRKTFVKITVDDALKLYADADALLQAFDNVLSSSSAAKLSSTWKRDNIHDIKKWKGVKVSDENGRVSEVRLVAAAAGRNGEQDQPQKLTGSIDFAKLPRALTVLDLHQNELDGAVDLTALPRGLLELHLHGNKFSGPLDFSKLPATLSSLTLNSNKFTGPMDLSVIPAAVAQQMQQLHLHNNSFTQGGGTDLFFVDVAKAPLVTSSSSSSSSSSSTSSLRVDDDGTKVHCKTCLSADGLCLLAAFRDVQHLPSSWSSENVLPTTQQQQQGGSGGGGGVASWKGVTVQKGRVTRVTLTNCGLTGVVDFTKLPGALGVLMLDSNKLSGALNDDFTQLPPGLKCLYLSANDFSHQQQQSVVDPTATPTPPPPPPPPLPSLDLTQIPNTLQEIYLQDNEKLKSVTMLSSNTDCSIRVDGDELDDDDDDEQQHRVVVRRVTPPHCDAKTLLHGAFRNVRGLPASWNARNYGNVEDWVGITVGRGKSGHENNNNDENAERRVTRVELRDWNLSGTIDLAKLPNGLQILDLQMNKLGGNPDLASLPSSLQLLFLNDNRFSGTVPLWRLPQNLKLLQLSNNKFFQKTRQSSSSSCVVRIDDSVTVSTSLASRFPSRGASSSGPSASSLAFATGGGDAPNYSSAIADAQKLLAAFTITRTVEVRQEQQVGDDGNSNNNNNNNNNNSNSNEEGHEGNGEEETTTTMTTREESVRVVGLPASWTEANLDNIATWQGITIGENGRITTVDLHARQLSGAIDFTKFPSGLNVLMLDSNNLTSIEGAADYRGVDLTRLPGNLKLLYLNSNQLSGKIDLWKLPASMQVLQLQDNKLHGRTTLVNNATCTLRVDEGVDDQKALLVFPNADAKALLAAFSNVTSGVPTSSWHRQNIRNVREWAGVTVKSGREQKGEKRDRTQRIVVARDKNHRVVEVDLSQFRLPTSSSSNNHGGRATKKQKKTLGGGELRSYNLVGTLDFAKLPDGLKVLYVNSNKLTGHVDFKRLPPTMQKLWIQDNQLSGKMDLTELPFTMQRMWLQNNQFTGSDATGTEVDMRKLPMEMQIINITGNARIKRVRLRSTTHCVVETNDDVLRTGESEDGDPEGRLLIETVALVGAFMDTLQLPETWDKKKMENVDKWKGVVVEPPLPVVGGIKKLSPGSNIPQIVVIDLSRCKIFGSVDLTKLPKMLRELTLSENRLSSTGTDADGDPEVDLTQLPAGLRKLRINSNLLKNNPDNVIDLTKLPDTLEWLDLQKNKLCGPVDLTKLPVSLRELWLNDNQLETHDDDGDDDDGGGGDDAVLNFNLARLPAGLRVLELQNNKFSGRVALCYLPPKLETLNLSHNKLLAAASSGGLADPERFGSSASLTKLPRNLRELSLASNRFAGDVCTLSAALVPDRLTLLDLRDNQFTGTSLDFKTPADQRGGGGGGGGSGGASQRRQPPSSGLSSLFTAFPFLLPPGVSTTKSLAQEYPHSLEQLYLNKNNFTGRVHWQSFPKSMIIVALEDNKFSAMEGQKPSWCVVRTDSFADGQALLSAFVETSGTGWPLDAANPNLQNIGSWRGVVTDAKGRVVELGLSSQRISGRIDISSLPDALRVIDLGGNCLSGSVNLKKLPGAVEYVVLRSNLFTGNANLSELPTTLKVLDLRDNHFTDVERDVGTGSSSSSSSSSGPPPSRSRPEILLDPYLALLADAEALLDGAFKNTKYLPPSWSKRDWKGTVERAIKAAGAGAGRSSLSDTLRDSFFAKWRGVTIEAERIAKIDLSGCRLAGLVDLAKLPDGLRSLDLRSNRELDGVILVDGDIADLPQKKNLEVHLDDSMQVFPRDDARALLAAFRDVRGLPQEAEAVTATRRSQKKLVQQKPKIKCWCDESLVDVAQWPGVVVDAAADAAGGGGGGTFRVIELRLSRRELSGTIDLTKLPSGLRVLTASSNKLQGTLALSQLPKTLKVLDLKQNQFVSDSINLTRLPASLEELDLSSNANISGSISSLSSLPRTLKTLVLSGNALSGQLPGLGSLPPQLEELFLDSNQFTGNLSIPPFLPGSLLRIHLQRNRLTGRVSCEKLPSTLELLDLRHNKLSAVCNVKYRKPTNSSGRGADGTTTTSTSSGGDSGSVVKADLFDDELALLTAFYDTQNMPPSWKAQDHLIARTTENVRQFKGVTISAETGRVSEVHLDGQKLANVVRFNELPEGLEVLHLQNNAITGDLGSLESVLPAQLKEIRLDGNKLEWKASSSLLDLAGLPKTMKSLQLQNNSATLNTAAAAGKTSSLSSVQISSTSSCDVKVDSGIDVERV